jgi:DNA-binding NarL/FixJ family response regulator
MLPPLDPSQRKSRAIDVVLVEHDRRFAHALGAWLDTFADVRVIATVYSEWAATPIVTTLQPHAVLAGWHFRGEEADALAHLLDACGSETHVIALLPEPSPAYRAQALRQGVAAVAAKESCGNELPQLLACLSGLQCRGATTR